MGLDRILTALAESARAELEMRRKVELERRALRRQAQRIAGAVVGFAAAAGAVRPGWVSPYSTPRRSADPGLLMGRLPGAFIRMRSLAESEPQPRFLTSADAVTEIASYKPQLEPAPSLGTVTHMITFMLAAGCVAAALLHAFRLAVPPRPDLVAGVDKWDRDRARASRVQRIGAPDAATITQRIVRRLADELSNRLENMTRLNQDLAISGTSLEEHLTKVLTLALAGLLGPIAIFSALRAAGLGLPALFAPAAGVFLAVAMVVVVHRELSETARKRRAEFRRTL